MPAKKTIVKKKNPTTVSKDYYGGTTTVFIDPKTGEKHVKYSAGGIDTYKKYRKDGSAAGGYTQNTFGVFGAADGGKKIPIPTNKPKFQEIKVTPPKKEIVKPASGETVAELWKKTTGTSWSEAKKQGLTDGSAKANLALMAKLKSGDYKPKPKEEPKVEPKVEPKPYVPAGFPGRTDGPIADGEKLNEMRRGGKVMATRKPKMAMGGTKKIVLKKPIKKAMYGTAMKPTMMKMGGSTLKKAMYGTMMKPKIMIKGSTKKK